MPETRGERIIFGIGALAIAALVALIVLEKTTDRFETRHTSAATEPVTTAAATKEAAAPAPPPATTAPETTTAPEMTTGETTAAPEPARIASGVSLTLSATADTWVEIRSGSAGGDVLYIPASSRRGARSASAARNCGHHSVPPRTSQRA
jgi:hypothetical protein